MLDRGKIVAEHMRTATLRTKDAVQDLSDDGQITPDEYASDRLRYAAEDSAHTVKQTIQAGTTKAKELIAKQRQEAASQKPVPENIEPPASGTRVGLVPEAPERSVGSRGSEAFRSKTGKRPLLRERTLSRTEGREQTIRQSARSTGTLTIRTKGAVCSEPKTAQVADRRIKTSAKTLGRGAREAEASVQAARGAAQKAAREAKNLAKRTRQTAQKTERLSKKASRAAVKTVRAIRNAARSLIAAIIAGGWVTVVVVVIILLIGLIVGSIQAIFFTAEDTGTGMTVPDAVRRINAEYRARIREIEETYAHDELVQSGAPCAWKEVLAVYTVLLNTDPEHPQEAVGMDEDRYQLLFQVFWDMNEISARTESYTEIVAETATDTDGNEVETEVTVQRTRLVITVTGKTASETAELYGFDEQQRLQLEELLSEEYDALWRAVIHGVSASDDIVDLALSQLGNTGEIYWTYMGYNSRVEWCACFVSWCANECGYIEDGTLPKTASCSTGVQWFKGHDRWEDPTYVDTTGQTVPYIPAPGDIIYFDWDKAETNGQDGTADHVGIVEKVENGYIYTIEGNSSDIVSNNAWAVGYFEIYGFGVPAY